MEVNLITYEIPLQKEKVKRLCQVESKIVKVNDKINKRIEKKITT